MNRPRPRVAISRKTPLAQPPVAHVPQRPKTRGDCIDGPRPCPWFGCRYHLGLEVHRDGLLIFPHGCDDETLQRMPATCALDVADMGTPPAKLAELMGYSRARVNQLEATAAIKLREVLAEMAPGIASLVHAAAGDDDA